MNIALIFAGGTGTRMNTAAKPKQFLELYGKPVIIYTLEKFEDHEKIDEIILVCLSSWIDYAKELIKKYNITKCKCVIAGGESGQESIYNGLKIAHDKYSSESVAVLIHDGVRPMINKETITACIENVYSKGNAITTTPATETIFINGENNDVGEIVNRSLCSMARAPQCFFLKDIYDAHKKAKTEGKLDFVDSGMLMQYYGATLHMVEGPVENIKITTPMDFYLFKAMLDAKENMQIVGI